MASDSDDEMKRELERLRAENETLSHAYNFGMLWIGKDIIAN